MAKTFAFLFIALVLFSAYANDGALALSKSMKLAAAGNDEGGCEGNSCGDSTTDCCEHFMCYYGKCTYCPRC